MLLSSCDKTTPAVLMGAASANVPTILVTGGPQMVGNWRGKDGRLRHRLLAVQLRRPHGECQPEEYRDFESSLCRSHGHCMEMATAMSMARRGRSAGHRAPRQRVDPCQSTRDDQCWPNARAVGRLHLADEDVRPRDIMTREAFQNAIRVVMAIGGSTNAVVHMLAIAGRLGVDLSLDDFAAEKDVPLLANLRPSGEHLLDRFFYAGGVQALMAEMGDLLHRDLMTVNGKTVGREPDDTAFPRPRRDPPSQGPGLRGAAPSRCSAGTWPPAERSSSVAPPIPHLFRHRGPAFVFENVET